MSQFRSDEPSNSGLSTVAALAAALLLVGCAAHEPEPDGTVLTVAHMPDGCTLTKVKESDTYSGVVFVAKCPNAKATATYDDTVRSGKTTRGELQTVETRP